MEPSIFDHSAGQLAMLEATRRSLHAVAELLLAGPQFARSQSIELRVTVGGFGTTAAPDVRVDGAEVVAGDLRFALTGRSVAELGTAIGVEPRSLRDVYADGPELGPHEPLIVDTASAEAIAQAFAFGDGALAELDDSQHRVLWPEHFDVAMTAEEVNYGVSPGDDSCPEPYAYVGPWDPARRTDAGDPFWNASFGASRTIRELVDQAGVLEFFRAGRDKT